MSGVKLVVTRLGETALDATLTYRKPVITVYNPRWSRHDASREDAEMFAKKIGAKLLDVDEAIRLLESSRVEEPPRPPTKVRRCCKNL